MERNLSSRLWRAIYERARLCLILTGSVCALPVAIVLSLIAPIYRVRSGFLFVDRIGHFAFDAEYYLSGIASDKVSQKCGHDIFFYEGKLSNEQLSRMFRRHVWTSGLVRFLYTANTWLPWAAKQNITPARMRNGSRDLEGNLRRVEHQLKFTDWEDRQGHAALAEFGLSHSDYFVCLQVRDPAYLGSTRPESNWSYHSYRDCDIRTYHSTVRGLSMQILGPAQFAKAEDLELHSDRPWSLSLCNRHLLVFPGTSDRPPRLTGSPLLLPS